MTPVSTHNPTCSPLIFRERANITVGVHFRDAQATEEIIYCDVHDCLESSRDDSPFYCATMTDKVYAALEGIIIERYGVDLDSLPYPFSYTTLPSVDLVRKIEELALAILKAGKEIDSQGA